MEKINIWEQTDFERLAAELESQSVVIPREAKKMVAKRKAKPSGSLSQEAKKINKWKDGLKDIIKKPMMIEKGIHNRMKRYCVDKEINIFDYTCDLIDRDLKKNGY